ncbi:MULTISPECIES: methylisocitrate lyase [Acidiplasma]|nr:MULTISPECIES: methylisocitrate lyase [unclassified Acidiplasma]KJE49212.1 methylisocitrate lyase [Acidiplasma sp. MBA-1]WMT54830.1 MAG: methylisocitrate lyase [Acidiplasma sp.]
MSNLLDEKFTVVPGVFNPFAALLAKRNGFKAVYLSGGALTSSYGLPDLGMISITELADMVRKIHEVTDIPVIVDADTGFGETLNVYRTVRLLEDAGAAAIQIEDQVSPKRCGHLDGKEVISRENMIEKIRSANMARKKSLIIARTDSRAVKGLDEAVERARIYIDEGADIIFPEALTSVDEFKYVADKVDAPLLANMTEFGKTPLIDAGTFERLGYRFVIFPVTTFRAAARAMDETLKALKSDGTQKNIMNNLMTRAEQYDVINYKFYEDFDKNIAERDKKML